MAAPAREAHPAAPSAARRLPLGWILGCAGALGLVLAAIVAVVAFLGPVVGNVTTPITTAPPTPGAAATQPGAQATAAGDTGGPAANGGAWTSWTAANIVTTLAVTEDKIYAGGWGGVTVWSLADGTVLQRITTGDGLPDTYVNALLVDEEDETLWVGTGFGLAAFDGERWTIYDADDGLDSDYVSALAWVDEGLLVGTQYSGRDGGGLNLLTDAGWQPVPGFPSADADQQPDKLSYQVNLILEADGVWWVGTQNGLGRFDGQAWTRFSAADGLPGDYITALMLDDDDALWVAAQGETAGVARFDGERFAPVERLQDFYVYGMIQDSRGDYWFAGGGGLARFHPDRRDWEFYDSSRFPAYSLIGAAEDEADNLYFGSDGGGLVRYDGSNFRAWAVPNVPGVAAYGRILRAPNGQLLFTQEYGSFVDRLDPDTETWSPATDLPCDYCAPLAFDAEGRLWAGGDLGLWVIRGGGDALHLTTESGLPADLVTSVAFEQDVRRAWVGTEAGVARFDGQQVVDVLRADNAGLAGDFIQLVFAASDGSMWVAPEANLSRLRAGGAWQHFAAGDPFSYDVRVSDIAEDASGAIWVATAGDGVYRYAQGNWQRFHPDTRGVGLPSPDVNCLTVAPDGSLWFGAYYSGAAHFDGNTWTTFGVGDGLIHSNVNDIYVDDAGTVWFATSGGVTRYRP
jgi:ligand-binding sensor domain-containing protein